MPIGARADDFAKKLGLADATDLLLWLPTGYRDLTAPLRGGIRAAAVGERVLLRVTLREQHRTKLAPKRWRLTLVCDDETGHRFDATVFGAVWAWKDVSPDSELLMRGVVKEFRGVLGLEQPERVDVAQVGAVVPVYRGKKGLVSADVLQATIAAILPQRLDHAVARLVGATGLDETRIAAIAGYRAPQDWLKAIHAPASMDDARRARQGADAIALAELTAHARRIEARPTEARSVLVCRDSDLSEIAARFGRTFTASQRKAAMRIVRELRGPRAARVLLTADVGCGKSIAFLLPALAAARSGSQVAVMVPRQLLVKKTVDEIRALAPDLPVHEVRAGEKARPGHVLVGTHALIGACRRAALDVHVLVIDEQQKFSRAQREALVQPHTNVIEVSATPIPRSVAMFQAGGADLIEIDERPVQRTVASRIVEARQKRDLFAYLRKLVDGGRQVAIVYPRIGGADEEDEDHQEADPAAAKGQLAPMVAEWEKRFPGTVAVLHGQLEAQETDCELQRVMSGQAKVIIATTVIELGITLPDLKALVVIEAERMGMSQLHQLRGRVARLGGKGAFFMLPGQNCSEPQAARLRAVAESNNGFELAERELEMRGMGDLSADSERQAGSTASIFPTMRLSPAQLRGAARHAEQPETAARRAR